jgi:lipoprotein-anchoring transpeptidase ErfK/SrfK
MKIIRNRKRYIVTGIFFIILGFFSLINNVDAVESWYYTTDTSIGSSGRDEVGGFTSKESCLKNLSTVLPSWNPSKDCYLAENITITGFTPAEGKFGDNITITGTNFIGVSEVSIGGAVVSLPYVIVDSTTKIRIFGVPANATTGKITIKTQIHGEVVSSLDFIISSVPDDLKWWYKDNAYNSIKGPFSTLNECNQGRTNYRSYFDNIDLGECFQDTLESMKAKKDRAKNPVLINPKQYSDKETGIKWAYTNTSNNARGDYFNSQDLCEKYRSVNSLTDSTTQCESVYSLLAPIGDFTEAPNNIGDYFNIIFKIAIGLCGALAVVMIVIGGVQYMGDESIFGKTEAKSRITKAILGLLIALGSWALLNTVNPDLLGGKGVNIRQVSAEIVNLPDAGNDDIDPDFAKKDYKYSTSGGISPEVVKVVTQLKDGWEISSFRVYPNERMAIILKKGSKYDNTNVINIRGGKGGFSEVNSGVVGDRKTPKGTWKILSIITPGNGIPIYNKQGSNMGPSFWLLSPTTNGERGIGIHGNKTGALTNGTAGCILLKNADILALLPYIKTGITVTIND